MSREEAYQILGLYGYVTKTDVKKAYRILCKNLHPDKNPSSQALERYLAVQTAYQIILQMGWYQPDIPVVKPAVSGKIIGDPSMTKRYQELQFKERQTRRLKEEQRKRMEEKEAKRKQELEAQMKARKLPSEREAEKWKKIELEREAARIAQLIQKLMEL